MHKEQNSTWVKISKAC